MLLPKAVRCCPVFVPIWRYRVYSGGKFAGWSSLKEIWKCPECKTWSAYRDTFKDYVCPCKERRAGRERRRP